MCDALVWTTMADETEDGEYTTQALADVSQMGAIEVLVSQEQELLRPSSEGVKPDLSNDQTRAIDHGDLMDRTACLSSVDDENGEIRDPDLADDDGAPSDSNSHGETVREIEDVYANDSLDGLALLQPESSVSSSDEAPPAALQTDLLRSDAESEGFFDEIVRSSEDNETFRSESAGEEPAEESRSAVSRTEETAMLSDERLASDLSPIGLEEVLQPDEQFLVGSSNLFDGDDDFLTTLMTEQEASPALSEPIEPNQTSFPGNGTDPFSSASEAYEGETGSMEEVPEGWYNEDGEWNWYTEEERDLVKQSMGLSDQAGAETPERLADTLAWASASPRLLSESDARRTPVPEERSTNDNANDHINAVEETDAFDLMDRYAPKPIVLSSNASLSSVSTLPFQRPDGLSAPQPHHDIPPARNPAPVPSAYDPPQLRSQKSFIRSSSSLFTPPIPNAQPSSWALPLHPEVASPSNFLTDAQSPRAPPTLAPPPVTRRNPIQQRSLIQSEHQTFSLPPVVDKTAFGSRVAVASPLINPFVPSAKAGAVSPYSSPTSTYDSFPSTQRGQMRPQSTTCSPPPVSGFRSGGRPPSPDDAPSQAALQGFHRPASPVLPMRSYTPPQPSLYHAYHSPAGSPQLPSQVGEPTADVSYVPSAQNVDVAVDQELLDRQGRSARRRPIFSFGFGGVVATSFPAVEVSASTDTTLADLAAGYGYGSLRARVSICTIGDAVPMSAVNVSDISFPGPLGGEGLSNRASDKATKQRREGVLEYLDGRIDESVKALTFLSSSSSFSARRDEGDRLIALRALKVLVTYNGVVPKTGEGAEDLRDIFSLPERAHQARSAGHHSQEVINEVPALPAQETLRLLGPLMSTGKTSDALELAIQRKAWAEALLIASSLGEAAWKRTTEIYEESLFAIPDVDQSLRPTFAVLSGRGEDLVTRLCSIKEKDDSSFDHWEQDVAALIEHGKSGEQDHLLRLGRHLGSLSMSSAAFTCFLFSSELVRWSEGSFDFALLDNASRRDFEDSVIMFEIAEFALALKRSSSKVREPAIHSSAGHAALLVCKLIRAFTLAERGHVDSAQRYCKALSGGHRADLPTYLFGNIQDLSDRLAGDISAIGLSLNPKGSKSAKLGSWVQGRFTKFIAGEDDSLVTDPKASELESAPSGPVGPFTHWSSITPMPEGTRALHELPASDRISGDDIPSSLLAAARDAYRPDSYSEQATPQASPPSQYQPLVNHDSAAAPQSHIPDDDEDDLGLGNYSSRTRTPRPTLQESDNSREEPKATTAKATAESPAAASSAKGSWLGRLWGKKEGEGTGPVRAKLGDESSMVFDPELKRWIVKGAKVDAVPPSVAPPPRAQTVSPAQRPPSISPVPPTRSAVTNPPSMSSTPKPVDLDTLSLASVGSANIAPPLKPPTRASTTGPPGMTAIDDLLTRPPSKRPGSAAAKKNIRKRYVDVLQPDS